MLALYGARTRCHLKFAAKRIARGYATADEAVNTSTTAHVKSINTLQELYYTNPVSPGCVFFLPRGANIFSKLTKFVRLQMLGHGFHEVVTPQMYRKELWETSGHWQHYKEDMFAISSSCDHDHEDVSEEYGLKPMNCPGHCIMFKSKEQSFRNMPVRYADFSPLHRNEASGALTGLTRVRRFHQDDGHIFCRPDQVAHEIAESIRLVDTVYKVFGLNYEMKLSTRPEQFTGDIEVWNKAENDLKAAMKNYEYTINDGDGAFYGPKIDFIVTDNLGNKHQAATIQLDFQLPRKFELSYDAQGGGMDTPVMIHRAVLGSLERFMALLIDHYDGKWPFWLNPTQAVVIPVSQTQSEYAKKVAQQLRNLHGTPISLSATPYEIDIYDQAEPIGKRLRRAQEIGASYIVVVGDQERQKGTISVRERGSRDSKEMKVPELLDSFANRLESYT